MPYREDLKRQIQQLEIEIANSQAKNLDLENRLMKLRLAEMEEDMREDVRQGKTLLKG